MTRIDLMYLEDHCITRKFVEFGYKGEAEGYTKEEYLRTKADKTAKLHLARFGFVSCIHNK